MKKNILITTIFIVLALALSSCSIAQNGTDDGYITASGNISTDKVDISSELGGKVADVVVDEGDWVSEGDVLFVIDDEIINAQYEQAEAAVLVAEAAVSGAEAQLEAADLQYEIALQAARSQEMEARALTWQMPKNDQFELPVWYFDKNEDLEALELEVESAEQELLTAKADLEKIIDEFPDDEFLLAEERLSNAQIEFDNADYVYTLAQDALDNEELETLAEEEYDAALAELDAAQQSYERLVTTTEAQEILEARANVAVAQALYDHASDLLLRYQTGEDALQVQAAALNVTLVETSLEQAKAGLVQAEAALNLLDIQLQKSEIKAPISGVVLSSNVMKGELISSGAVVMTVGSLDELTLTVYIPEEEYGKIKLGQEAIVTVDSFTDKTYTGEVTYIADEAEYTPRNVQTTEGRTNTVYAVKITLVNHDQDLKPGMPADVSIKTDNN